ncbi:MAG: hypothetical protein ACPG5P_06315, partial [Saprospiraceae bacterium]
MIKSKLINIYLHFNEKEKKEFLDFVRSPVHNQHEGVTKLYQFIFGLSDINPKSVLKEKAFKKVFGNIAFDNMKIIHVMSYLAKVMEDYLAFKEWKGQTYQRDFYALKSFRRRRMEKLFQKKIKQFDKIKEKEGIKDTDYYYHKYKVGIEHVQYISEQNRNIDS